MQQGRPKAAKVCREDLDPGDVDQMVAEGKLTYRLQPGIKSKGPQMQPRLGGGKAALDAQAPGEARVRDSLLEGVQPTLKESRSSCQNVSGRSDKALEKCRSL